MTASQRGRSNRRRGHDTERAVARYLRAVGFPHAERAEKNGWRTRDHVSRDPGDILGVPGIVWSVKNDARNEIPKWLNEAETVRHTHSADLAILVVRRPRKADVSRWWAWVSLPGLARLLLGASEAHDFTGHVCMELGDLVPMLHRAGYGDREVTA